MPSLENWDGRLKSLLWLANSNVYCIAIYIYTVHELYALLHTLDIEFHMVYVYMFIFTVLL